MIVNEGDQILGIFQSLFCFCLIIVIGRHTRRKSIGIARRNVMTVEAAGGVE